MRHTGERTYWDCQCDYCKNHLCVLDTDSSGQVLPKCHHPKCQNNIRGKKKMETKSRYQVILELEDKKRSLIKQRESLDDVEYNKEKEIKYAERELQDMKDDFAQFKKQKKSEKDKYDLLIKSVEHSLEQINTQK